MVRWEHILQALAVVPVVMMTESAAPDLLAEDPGDPVEEEVEQQLAPFRIIAGEAMAGL